VSDSLRRPKAPPGNVGVFRVRSYEGVRNGHASFTMEHLSTVNPLNGVLNPCNGAGSAVGRYRHETPSATHAEPAAMSTQNSVGASLGLVSRGVAVAFPTQCDTAAASGSGKATAALLLSPLIVDRRNHDFPRNCEGLSPLDGDRGADREGDTEWTLAMPALPTRGRPEQVERRPPSQRLLDGNNPVEDGTRLH
jgi:hypothetical protein